MLRLFVSPETIIGDQVIFTGSEAYRISRVLRLTPGAKITVLDGQGQEYLVTIETVRPERVITRVEWQKKVKPDIFPEVTLVQGLPKSNKIELVLQKATELGVAQIQPLLTMRTVPQPEMTRLEQRLRRWQQIVREAAQQCRRETIPVINLPVDLKTCLAGLGPGTTAFLLWEDEQITGIKEVLRHWDAPHPGRIAVLVGPEGGWSPPEVKEVLSTGVIPVSLGPRILRTETAGIIALALIMYEWGVLGGSPSD